MRSQLYQLHVQMPTLEDVNVVILQRDSKPTLFGWEMFKDVLQSFTHQQGLELFQSFWPLTAMQKIN